MATERKVSVVVDILPGKTDALSSAFRKIGNVVQDAGSRVLGLATKGLLGGGVAGGAAAGLAGMAKSIVELTAVSNPGIVKRFTLALQDMWGVLGHRLAPIVELFTKALRFLGDVLAAILPSSQDVRDALAPINDIFEDLYDIVAEVAPLLREVFKLLVQGFAVALKALLTPLRVLVQFMRGLGLIGNEGGKVKGGSVGAAARPAAFEGVEDYARKVYTTILSSQGMEKTPEEKQVDLLGNTNTILKDILSALNKGFSLGFASGAAGLVSQGLVKEAGPSVAVGGGYGVLAGAGLSQNLEPQNLVDLLTGGVSGFVGGKLRDAVKRGIDGSSTS